MAGYLDGVQPPALAVAYRVHRPVVLGYVGACVKPPGTDPPDPHLRRVVVVACHLDTAWLRPHAAAAGVDVVESEESTAWGVAAAASEVLSCLRAAMERRVYREATIPAGSLLVVDGSLAGLPPRPAVGVVKTTATQWLTDESEITELPVG